MVKELVQWMLMSLGQKGKNENKKIKNKKVNQENQGRRETCADSL